VSLHREECELRVKGFTGAHYKKFTTLDEANAFAYAGPKANTAASAAKPSSNNLASESVAPSTLTAHDVKGKQKAVASQREGQDSKDSDEPSNEVVYCDGACKGNGKTGSVAGIGIWWGHNDERYFSLFLQSQVLHLL
jgi:ribonuclease HI